jgi:superfamily II DNA or RNA helicase
VTLRPYQSAFIDRLYAAAARGWRRARLDGHTRGPRLVGVSPTGSGKTRIATEIVRRAVAKGKRVLCLAHRTELVAQAVKTIVDAGIVVGCIAASSAWAVVADAPVQVASIQTLLARGVYPPADLVVWDECHHCSEAAEEWSSLLTHYPDAFVVGLTATPERGDGSGLAPLFEDLVLGPTVRELTELKHLVPCEVVRPGRVLKAGEIAQDPVTAYLEHGEQRQAIAYVRSVEEAEGLAARFSAACVSAACIHATSGADFRAKALEDYRAGRLRVLTNVYVLTEGTDLPMCKCIILARGCGTAGMFLQIVGRGLRPHGEQTALLLDLVGSSHLHGMPEDERGYSLEGRGIKPVTVPMCPRCGSVRGDDGGCASCGWSPSGEAEPTQTTVTGEKLVKFARMLAQGPQQREETLERWIRAALIKGNKPGSAAHKFRAVYGASPDRDVYARALHRAAKEMANG